MELPKAKDSCVLLIRTDYSDEQAWRRALAAASAIYKRGDFDRMGANFQPVESAELAGLSSEDLVQLPRTGYLSQLAVADARTMADQTLLFVDLNEYNGQVGRSFRSVPEEAEGIVANLTLANMDFFDFADNVGPDGVFRGF